MTVLPPLAGIQAGYTSGGGLLATLTGGASTTQTGAAVPGPKGDGSIGLFDGVLKKALIGGVAGAAIGFIPFLPGGPVLGGIMGALSGAAMGMFSNWSNMKVIKQENEATMAALGVQSQDPNVQQVLQSGNVSQLIPMMQAQQGATAQAGAQTAAQTTAQTAAQLPGADTGPGTVPIGTQTPQGRIATVTDPATGISQLINVDTGTVVEQGAAGVATATAQQQAAAMAAGQTPVPVQGSISVGTGAAGSGAAAAINPNAAVNPGVAPALQGGGDSVAEAEQPADTQAQTDKRKLDKAQLARFIQSLQTQIDQLKEYLAEQERSDELDKAAAR